MDLRDRWALILGASSGFGGATAVALARQGMHIAGVHLDRAQTLENAAKIREEILALGRQAVFFNANAANEANRTQILDSVSSALRDSAFHVLLHSLAFGALKPFVGEDSITKAQLEMTLDVMAHSLLYWVQDLLRRNLLVPGSRVFAMTSAGSTRVWPSYGAVSVAKAALEAHVRQLAFELAPRSIAVNAIRAGVTDTPSMRRIPASEEMARLAIERNPGKRMTRPEDVANAIVALAQMDTSWLTGNVISVDGGEILV